MKVIINTLTLILVIVFEAFVFLQLYDWFILTTFSTISLNIYQSIGICFFVEFLKKKDIENFNIVEQIAFYLFFDAIILVLGFILHLIIHS